MTYAVQQVDNLSWNDEGKCYSPLFPDYFYWERHGDTAIHLTYEGAPCDAPRAHDHPWLVYIRWEERVLGGTFVARIDGDLANGRVPEEDGTLSHVMHWAEMQIVQKVLDGFDFESLCY